MPTFHIMQPAQQPGNIVAPSATLPTFLTQKELCAALRLTRASLNSAIAQGILPAGIKVTPRTRLWRMSDIVSRLA